MVNLTTHQTYHALNRRFEKRAKTLRKVGFVYKDIPNMNIAVFTKPNPYRFSATRTIAAAVLFYAGHREWQNILKDTLRRW